MDNLKIWKNLQKYNKSLEVQQEAEQFGRLPRSESVKKRPISRK